MGVTSWSLASLEPDTLSPVRFLKRRVLSSVDFPAPLAPMIARNSPGLTIPDAEKIHRQSEVLRPIVQFHIWNQMFFTIVKDCLWGLFPFFRSKKSTKSIKN